ncbi:GPW/gp25 family protein [Sphingomonas sp. DOAB1063]|uniref:GPW/gp25 family protein n=2 Tax=Sphingomonas albertensis TaxID=2762591 RepID=A0ABR7AKF8_9SPHN|nr:GPW/gp25 family protein [Sphingomonas albertensis]
MNGMNARTGAPLDGVDHLTQSIADILSTPIGSRIARRDYGSLLPDLIDQAMNPAGRMRLLAATALALLRWEPRITLTNVALGQIGPASFALILDGKRTDVPALAARTRLSIPLAGALPA